MIHVYHGLSLIHIYTETPVVLVVNGRGASLSLAAVIRGIAEFLPCANVRLSLIHI